MPAKVPFRPRNLGRPIGRIGLVLIALGAAGVAGCGSGGGAWSGAGDDPAAAAPGPVPEAPLRIASYNIRHGRGMDDEVDLERTAGVLNALRPDIVALQEVDEGTTRSGNVDQSRELGRLTGLDPAFGAFMDYQGGRYGMAILSRYPIDRAWSIELPPGNEPRVALAARIVRPPADTVVVVNVHFDWVADDGFRFAQAQALAAVLDTLAYPFVLVGDLNDQPGSRTHALFEARALQATAPENARLTFPADAPGREIDFVFGGPHGAWQVRSARVVDERVASDHRPVVAELVRVPGAR
jgi:endonuclease/exonuclease/phosphatase family metal-dependent hydrolase